MLFRLEEDLYYITRALNYIHFVHHNLLALFFVGTDIIEVKLIKKILVIDDNNIFCNAIKNHLSQKEYVVEVCVSYHAFQNKKNIKEFDLILLDMRLKDGEGFDILKYILEIIPGKKVIMVSAYLDSENILKAKMLGAYKCINKNSKLFQELDRIFETL